MNPAEGGGATGRPVSSPAGASSHPAADLRRLQRAVHLDCRRLEDGTWNVTGGTAPHRVNANTRTCDCRDYQLHGQPCKHIARVLLAVGDAATLEALRHVVEQPKRARGPRAAA